MKSNNTIGSTATAVQRDGDIIRVIYHSTCVVEVLPDGTITLNSGGYLTQTTKRRMNEASELFDLGFTVQQIKGAWFVTHNGHTVPFYDKMTLGGK